MSFAAFIPLSESVVIRRVSWASADSLFRFVQAAQRGSGVGSGPQSESSRATLAVWIRMKFNIVAVDSGSGALASSADEAMLYWLVVYFRSGCTHEEVLIWLFPVFGSLLFQMFVDSVVEGCVLFCLPSCNTLLLSTYAASCVGHVSAVCIVEERGMLVFSRSSLVLSISSHVPSVCPCRLWSVMM